MFKDLIRIYKMNNNGNKKRNTISDIFRMFTVHK